ncbi:collagen alpha-4(VI) chain-like [Tiliqua scincoides]|uniref:collagen alpha-4(VI) chain-like n=1 Tax=Tiliqua scincoides TaxID=71010 RepID=UPI0034621603
MDKWNEVLILMCLTILCSTDAKNTVCREASVADLVFLVDGSWSIGVKNFKSMQDFLYTLVNGLDIGEDKIRIGLIQYSDQPHNEFFLNTYDHKEDILQKIQTLHYKGGGTKTGESLMFMLENQFNEMAGSRHKEGIPQVAVVITDGQAQDNIQRPAKAVKDAGITLYAVGIKEAVLSELQEIASDPTETHVYSVADFTALQGISQNLLQVLCTTVEEATRKITKVSPVCRNATVADIVFLVDSSSSVGPENFQKVKNFIDTLVSSLNIGSNHVRIGLAQYSDAPYVEFLLNQYSLKNDILEQIQNLSFRGGNSYTGAALNFIRERYFTKAAGSRAQEHVSQVIILITDGESNDDVKIPATELRAEGISIYVVGIGIQDMTELKEIASKPFEKFLFNTDNFDILKNLPSSLLQTVCFAVENQIKAFTKHYADVVFLVDSSERMESSTFEAIKKFIAQIVEQLDIGVDKYRIGFAQYSHEGRTEFLLNTYKNKEDILNHIQSSAVFTGGSLQTGSALQFLRDVHFTEEAGSRFNQGTPQFAVVVTSAKSEDNIKESARELKEMGVKVITVGVLNADQEEIEVIATSPLVFQLDEVETLNQLHNNVTDILEAPVQEQYKDALQAEVPSVCSTAAVADIVFLVDESSRIGQRNFQLTRMFLFKVINALDISPDNVRVALVLYSDEPRLEFSLDTFEDKSEILNYLKKLPYRGGQTYTGAALDFLRKKVFTKKAGSRKHQGVQQLAVVITDGQSLDNFTKPAAKLRRSKVTVYAVGPQNISEPGPLHKMASYPPRKHVTNLESFLQLTHIDWKIKKRLCTGIVSRAFAVPARSRNVKEGCEETEEADIYFLIDGSGSIFPDDFQDMKVFMTEMINMFQVGANRVRFGVVQYGSTPVLEFLINEYNTVEQLKRAIKAIQQMGTGTRTGDALRYMRRLFKDATRDNVPQFLIIITDGKSQDNVTKAAEELRAAGITIFAIGIKEAFKEELEDIAGTKDRMFFVNDFDSLKLLKHDIVRDICSPEVCKNLKADIILLIDTSDSMNQVQFEKTKEFLQSLVNKSDIGADKVQIGLLQYSSNPKEEFPLNRYNNKADLRTAISAMRQIKEGTMTGKALDFASLYFDQSKGGRPEAKQYLIVITDGASDDKVQKPAKALRDKGVIIYAIGLLEADNSELLEIAGTQDKVFSEDNFDSLMFLDKPILFEICNTKDACKRTEVADIIFVVHGRRDITELQFKGIQRLMEAVVNDSVVAKDSVQFGAVVYSTLPEEQFSLNQYSTKPEIREAISKLTLLRGFTFTARALTFAKERFSTAYGGRTSPGITRILVLITDEPTTPTDRPNLPAAAEALKQGGIKIIAIGIDEASRTELEEIAGDDGRWYFAPSYNALESLHENITHDICDDSKPACDTQQADLVFLIDGSSSIPEENFLAMKTFMKEIVDSFVIAQDKVQIGVAQYSEDPQKEFYLNEFFTDDAIKGKIDSIVQLRASTFTGKGLRFVKRFFEASNGSRKNKGVLQFLIVITDGQSDDAVDEAAISLRNDGIQVFVIGIGILNSFELVRISGSAQRVYTVENFEGLKTIEKKFVTDICDPGDMPIQDCNIDISVGVDISKYARQTLHLKQKMQEYLPRLLQQMGTTINVSCITESPVNIRFRFQVFASNGQALFDSDFEAYTEEIIQKFLDVQTTVDTYLNVGFLRSFWDRSFSLASEKVKVLLVFTDGPDDSIEMLKTTAAVLRMGGLGALLMIGLDDMQEYQKLQEIEFGRGFGYGQPLHIGNPELPGLLWRELDTITERKCCSVCCKCLGEDGSQGAPGTAGRKGSVGFRGSPGHPGEEGGPGNQGPMGHRGRRGWAGCSGARGAKGARGNQGEKGEAGELGLDGINGQEGERGAPGSSGEKGRMGRRGREGPRGEPGDHGPPGLRGGNGDPGIDNNVFGSPGRRGNPGWQGEPGPDGIEGNPGETGANGPSGRRGHPGLKGIQGDEGEPGYPGEIGLPGQQGSPGIMGETGSVGNPGPHGTKGEHGDPGEKGLLGPSGLRGLPGLDGSDGYGMQGKKGAKGQSGFPGYPGLQGEDGDPGIAGDRGPRGIRGQRASGGMPGLAGDPGSRGPPGRMGNKGPNGRLAMTPCELVNLTRGNCPCCIGMSQCPVYPTEVVFALDMSGDVTTASFERMKDIMLSLLKGITITRSNCPTGARVAVVSYNANTKYVIRFTDFRRDDLLLEAVQRIPLERSSGKRNLGRAMRFVARNVFKRHRQGVLMRKVAIFLTAGPSQEATPINTAVLEFSALDITPVVIALSEVPIVQQAFLVDDTRQFQLFVWESKEEENLDSISRCALCYDKCNPNPECELAPLPPILINMDIAFIMDSSRNVGSEEFESMKEFVSSMLDYFAIAPQPIEFDGGARVALVQHVPRNFTFDGTSSPVHNEFDLVTYNSEHLMKRHIQESVRQLEGPSAVGHALEWTVKNVFLEAPSPRKRRIIFTILGSETSSWDREKLREMSLEAKCQGFTLFTLALGRGVDDTEITELSSAPVEQHLLQLGRVDKPEWPYALQFSRAFLNLLKRGLNPYPPPELQEECESLDRGDTLRQLIGGTDRIFIPELDHSHTLEPSELPRSNIPENITEATQEPVEYILKEEEGREGKEEDEEEEHEVEEEEHVYVENEHFTESTVHHGKGTEHEEHLDQVQSARDACAVNKDSGECDNYSLKWYYNQEQDTCSQFWYGGCGGNKNRFETQEECETLCFVSS